MNMEQESGLLPTMIGKLFEMTGLPEETQNKLAVFIAGVLTTITVQGLIKAFGG